MHLQNHQLLHSVFFLNMSYCKISGQINPVEFETCSFLRWHCRDIFKRCNTSVKTSVVTVCEHFTLTVHSPHGCK